jgi:hypothetical protein
MSNQEYELIYTTTDRQLAVELGKELSDTAKYHWIFSKLINDVGEPFIFEISAKPIVNNPFLVDGYLDELKDLRSYAIGYSKAYSAHH